MKKYDAIVAGGSISGLLAAREIAKKGYSVLVLEEGFEVGTPDHCGGLVSKSALRDLGIEPSQKTFDCVINTAQIFSPSRKRITMFISIRSKERLSKMQEEPNTTQEDSSMRRKSFSPMTRPALQKMRRM